MWEEYQWVVVFSFSSPEITDPAVPETDIAAAKDELAAIVFDFQFQMTHKPDFRVFVAKYTSSWQMGKAFLESWSDCVA